MRKSVFALTAAMLVVMIAQRDSAAQLLCEQYPGCTTYPGDSISGGSTDPGDPSTGDQQLPQFAVNEQFGSFGGQSFVSTDAAIIGDFLSPRIIFEGRTIFTPGGTHRFKMADNQSPIPRNRVFYNFSHFRNAVDDAVASQFDVNRHTFGIERLIMGGMGSVEVRIPFAETTGSDQVVANGAVPFNEAVEFGDIAFAFKVLLTNQQLFQVSAGIAGSLPTANDLTLNQNGNLTILENEAVHMGPFVGIVVRPGSRLVVQSVLQMDFDVNGNDFTQVNTGTTGTFQDQNLFMAAVSAAYWWKQNMNGDLVSDFATIVELHYTTSTIDGDFIVPNGYSQYRSNAIIATEGSTTNILNMTGGCEFRFGPQNSVVVGCGVPLRQNNAQDALFDAEVIFQYNRFY